ncbi:hypothetical protein BBR01nite_11010 [Brevibacillus brevis]|nr:hypothetical protein BBR01nite_11010 [Brevibacillus brevis]
MALNSQHRVAPIAIFPDRRTLESAVYIKSHPTASSDGSYLSYLFRLTQV